MSSKLEQSIGTGRLSKTRSTRYLVFLVILMGVVAIMDQYLSTIKSTALPYLMQEYQIDASGFSWLETLYMIPTFFIFLLNGLNDLIGRKWSILILIVMMGLSSLAIVLWTPTLTWFMAFYTVTMFTTVSNMWTIPPAEEAPAQNRAKLVSVAYVIGLIPLQAILPPILVNTLGLSWKWMWGVMFLLMLPVLVMWAFMKETRRYQVIQVERREGTSKIHPFGLGAINRKDIRYILYGASIWICWLVNSLLFLWAGYYFMTIKGFTLSQWSMVLLGALVMAILGGLSSGWIMDRIGRRAALVTGCLGMALTFGLWGFMPASVLPFLAALTGFFISFSYTWIVVYVPEVFPTERRGACMGWTTTVARLAYLIGPALAAILLGNSPTMEWYWMLAGAVMLVPVAIVFIFRFYETKTKELEKIAVER
jgi:MFS family permease